MKNSEAMTDETTPVSKFDKRQILRSEKYGNRRDLLNVLLEGNQQYSHEEIAALIDGFMKGGKR